MELAKGYPAKLIFTIPESVVVTVNIVSTTVTISPFTVTPVAGAKRVDIPIPYEVLHNDGDFDLSVSFVVDGKTFTRINKVTVYTPYLQLWELEDILDTTEEKECWRVEAAARNIINSHCGQSFGSSEKTVSFVGDAGIALRLPEHLTRLDKLSEGSQTLYDVNTPRGNTFLGAGNYLVTGSGWFLKRPNGSYDDWDGEFYSSDPIAAPSVRGSGYKNDATYAIKGSWGYKEIPSAIQEATKLLVNDYACGEQIYRDRFLESMKAADWRIQFNSAAYYRTGNARANLLLSPYVVNRMLII